MIRKNFVQIIFLILIFGLSCQSKLYQVISLFRHGARYHTNNIYDGNSTFSMYGELTSVGMRQQQNLGKIMRKEYIEKINLLSDHFNSSQIEIYSTRYNRTIQSAISHLYGLYPLGTGPKMPYADRKYHLPPYSNKTDIIQQNLALPLGHQPIQVSYDDKVILRDCSTYDDMVAKNIQLQKQTYDEMNMTYYPFLKRMASIFYKNRTAITLQQSTDLFDTLEVDKYLARPFPSNFTQEDYKNLQHLYSWFYNFVHTKDLSKMINTYKFNKLISLFDLRTKLPKTYAIKMTIMSAHDSDMVPLQTDLNISSAQCVQQLYRKGATDALNCKTYTGFCSNVQIELHSDDEISFYVMIKVEGQYVNLCGQKKTKCDYSDFKARIKKLIITNVQELCGKTTPNQSLKNILSLEEE